ncbi:MAG: type II toxin-antitoxin system RelE/ParE family toxin [Defluviitaleaceae bacterium]|nr:type II toxin-antitoxin system RelE/ParE family toxin [Defluviitaleaceae bacterium]
METDTRWQSGGVRVLHVDFVHQKKIVLLNCYGKSVKDSLSDKEKAAFKELVMQIGKELN